MGKAPGCRSLSLAAHQGVCRKQSHGKRAKVNNMRISQLQAWLEQQKAEHGDIETACMTAPFGTGETEVLEQKFLKVSTDKPSNGEPSTSKVLYIGS